MKKKVSWIKLAAKQTVMIALIVGLFSSGITVLWAMTLEIPDFDSYFDQRIIAESTKLYDRTGRVLLYNAHAEVRRTVVPLEDISKDAQEASIAIEDSNFYNHNGIEPGAIARAVWVNLNSGKLEQGGSTITQQVIKNTLLTQDKKITRKIKEWFLSVKLERKLSKNEILELYLNEIPYGGNLYGIEEASKAYFGKSANELTLAESAYLAALPQAPSYLSPFGNHTDKLVERKNLVLKRMVDMGYITQAEREAAVNEEVKFMKPDGRSIKAPHFVFFVLDYLQEKYGEEEVRNGGLTVITTLDWEVQQKAEDILTRYGEQNAASHNASNAGAVVIDPQTGQVLAMVGSIDYYDIENQGNFNVTLGLRQPGSAFKPFVYATAFNEGYTADTVVFDLPTEFNTSCTPGHVPTASGVTCYAPVNYDGSSAGPITFRNALAQSRNVPAVKALYLAGIKDSFDTARKLGITTLEDYRRYGLTLVLGGGEVRLLDMTSAYGVFANDGVRNPYAAVLEVKDAKKKTIEKFETAGTQALPPNSARMISSILSDNTARAPIFGANSPLNVPGRQVAVKTGTTNDYRDAWIVGYTPSVAVGMWVGNNNNSPMDKRVAGVIVAPIWNAFMTEYLKDKPVEYFIPPEPTPTDVKPILRGVWQGGRTRGNSENEQIIPSVHDTLYWLDKDDPRGPIPASPASDPQFRNWEAAVQAWAQNTGLGTGDDGAGSDDNGSSNGDGPDISVRKLNRTYERDDTVTISVSGTSDVRQADFFVNDTYLGTLSDGPFRFSFVPEEIGNLPSQSTVSVIAYGEDGSKTEVKTSLTLSAN